MDNLSYLVQCLYVHMEINNADEKEKKYIYDSIKIFPNCRYIGKMYRCLRLKDDEKVEFSYNLQSFSSNKDAAISVVMGMYNVDCVIIEQNSIGIDLVELLRTLKEYKEILNAEDYKTVCNLLNSYKNECEILAYLEYDIKITR